MPPKSRNTGLSRDEAESLALQALGWLATDFQRLGQFLGETGLSPETVRKAAADPAFLTSVLDYLVRNETVLVEFASEHGYEPPLVVTAHAKIGGAPV